MGISCQVFDRTLADSPYIVVEERCRLWNGSRSGLRRFRKAFDSVPRGILLKKLNCEFGVNGSLLD